MKRRSGARQLRSLAAVAVLATLLAATAALRGHAAEPPLAVVASFSILADLVRRVGGERVVVTSLVPAGADTHVFTPVPGHARQLAGARLVIVNGLGFEGWLDRLVRSSGYRGAVVVASQGVEPIRNDGLRERPRAGAHGHDHGRADPHAWQSVPNVRRYVANIAAALCRAAPADCDGFRTNAAAYDGQLAALDREIRERLAAIPRERRRVLTSHGAFGYYAREYGVTFLSPIGTSTDAEPSAASVARLIRQIRDERIGGYFVENVTDPRLVERIAAETGGARPARLYSDGLSAPDGPAPDYLAMMRANTGALAAALQHAE
ncbi:MAG: metal ABC transporter solute-binding protein, Zn/Mn family [Lautropia sp.]